MTILGCASKAQAGFTLCLSVLRNPLLGFHNRQVEKKRPKSDFVGNVHSMTHVRVQKLPTICNQYTRMVAFRALFKLYVGVQCNPLPVILRVYVALVDTRDIFNSD